jgi:peptidyl-prolyl cis-trans isomerase B (cyclophilin B)
MSIDTAKKYTAVIDTNRGKITVDLFPKEAPNTVNNFVFLARDKFYDGIKFHRVIPDFMVQTGDPEGSGRGGPGYKFADETDSRKNPHKHKVGTLSMANAGPNTNGSQFFITHVATDWLDGKHTVFGQVRDQASQAVVNSIKQGDVMNSVTIEEA